MRWSGSSPPIRGNYFLLSKQPQICVLPTDRVCPFIHLYYNVVICDWKSKEIWQSDRPGTLLPVGHSLVPDKLTGNDQLLDVKSAFGPDQIGHHTL